MTCSVTRWKFCNELRILFSSPAAFLFIYSYFQGMKIPVLLFVFFISLPGFSQEMNKESLYDPLEDAESEIDRALAEAKRQGKHVFIQAGGNWCVWCIRFENFIKADPQLDSMVQSNYIVYHLNYSKENYNAKLMAQYGYPQRFGFPVFLVLDGDGKLLHTQNTVYLEEGKSYSKKEVMGFLRDWSPAALEPSQYKEQ